MEVCALTLALGAFAIALVAFMRTARPRASIGNPSGDDAGGARADQPGAPARILRLIRPGRRAAGAASAREWLLRVIPPACAITAVTIVVATFAYQNTRMVRLDFLDWHLDRVPVAAAVLAAAILPAATVATLAVMERRRLRVTMRRLEHRLRELGDARRRPDRYSRLPPTLGSRVARSRRVDRLGRL